ncbi:MAG: glycosyltransferase [Acidisphaera sp.]|nr:glycosyltransferase [Acidisphaera sp.]
MPVSTPIVLFTPAAETGAQPGYIRRMLAALREAGHAAALAELGGDGDAAADAGAAWERLAEGARPVIDLRVLPAMTGLAERLATRRAVGVAERWPSAEDGDADADARRLVARLARVIVPAEPIAERLAAGCAIARERIAVVPAGTDPAPRSEGSGGPGCAILSCGAPAAADGGEVLLRALARLPDLDWRLLVLGASSDAAHAGALAGRVRFIADADAPTRERLWRDADMFALGACADAGAGAIAEALRRGLPVAVAGDAASLVPGDSGVVCPADDWEGLSKALRRLIFDTPLRSSMAEAAWRAGCALPDRTMQAAAFAAVLRQAASG